MAFRSWISMLALAYAFTGGGAAAQEAEVEGAIRATLAAWEEGDFQAFADYYHAGTRGFFLDGGFLVEGVNVAGLQASYEAGIRAQLEIRELDVALYGETAVSVAYLDGSLTLPGGIERPGTWRYSETRIRDGSVWRVVQYHFSEQATPPG